MIRNFRKDDIDKVMQLWLETNVKAHHFIDSSYWNDNYNMVKEILPKATIYVYDENDEIQGFIGLMDGYIAGIFVSNKCQSKGIGKALLDYVKEQNSELLLSVYKKNNRAKQFYLREGFTIDSEQIDKSTGEVEFLMKWEA